MEYNILGKSDLKVSKICLGTMTFGQQNTEDQGHAQLDTAIDLGINFFDTAEMYSVPARKETQGSTEKILGNWFKKTGKRKDIILASKITGPSRGLTYISENLDFSEIRMRSAIEGSLTRLQTDYLDLYQLHWPQRRTNYFGQLDYPLPSDNEWVDNFLEVIQTMDALRKEGKIRYWGLSNETPWGIMRSCVVADKADLPRPLSIQNPYNLLNRTFEIGSSEISIRENIPLLVYSPLAFGLLSGKYHKNMDTPECRINQFPNLSRYSSDIVRDVAARYIQIADDAGLSPSQMALAYVNEKPFVGANIIGATTVPQLIENIESINIKLPDEVITAINQVHKSHANPAP
ncbi:MAG: aldo/keto reductase [Saprospiraceae bacterium]